MVAAVGRLERLTSTLEAVYVREGPHNGQGGKGVAQVEVNKELDYKIFLILSLRERRS